MPDFNKLLYLLRSQGNKIQVYIFSLKGVLAQPFPSPKFSWLNERSESGIPHLAMEVEGHKLNAVLDPYNPIPIEADESRSAVDPCIFKGKLDTDDQSQVLVTGGCPGEDSFEVSWITHC